MIITTTTTTTTTHNNNNNNNNNHNNSHNNDNSLAEWAPGPSAPGNLACHTCAEQPTAACLRGCSAGGGPGTPLAPKF